MSNVRENNQQEKCRTNEAGLNLIREFEGCRLTAYRDIVGIWTVGYGHTGPDVYEGLTIDPEQANELLQKDLERFETGVTGLVKVPLNSNQFSALVCFSYNVGLGNLKASTLLRCLNFHNYSDAAREFTRWSKAGGKVVEGLLRRRQAESQLFSTL